MKNEKFLTRATFRLMALLLCLSASIPQMQADYVVAGSSAAVFGSTWNGSSSDNKMTNYATNSYMLIKPNCSLTGGNIEYKIVKDGNTWYGDGNGQNFKINTSSGTYDVIFGFYSDNTAYQVYQILQRVNIAGCTELMGCNWDTNQNRMSADITSYKLTLTDVSLSAGSTYTFKAVVDGNTWYGQNGSTQGGNYELTVDETGLYDVTFMYNPITHVTSTTKTKKSTPHYYVTGDSGLGLNGFTCNPTLELTDSDNDGIYTYTTTANATGTFGFIFANGKNDDWNTFNSNYRIGPTNGNETVTLNSSSYANTQLAGGDHGKYLVSVAAGSVTFHFNPTTMKFKVTGTQPPTYNYTFYVQKNDALTSSPYLYLWDSSQNDLNGGWPGTTTNVTEVLADGKTWYKFTGAYIVQSVNAIVNKGNGQNQTNDITGLAPGTYYITWDGSNKDNNGLTVTTTAPTAPIPHYYVTGDSGLGLDGWSYSPQLELTDSDNDGIYTYTATVSATGTYGFVFANGQANNDWNTFNSTYRIGPTNGNETVTLNGSYQNTQLAGGDNGHYNVTVAAGTVTFSLNTNTTPMQFKVEGTAPATNTYEIYVRYKGDNLSNVRLHVWDGNNTNLTGNWPGVNINSFETVTANGHTYYHTTFTSFYNTLGVILNMNESPQTDNLTAQPGNNYYTYEGGTTATWSTSPDPAIIYYVVGDEDLIGHDWTIANDAAMTNNSWTKTGIHLNMGTYNLKVKDSDGNWYGNSNGDNVTVTADENGTYTLTVTRDASTGVVSATLTRTATDATQTYNIYVRYTGNEDPENVRLHAWNAVTSYDSWPGVQFSTMTTQVINGHTYYKYTITNTTATSIGLQFNENGSSSTQTANLTAQPGDSYFTYGGGSTVTGPNNSADALDTYYIEGSEGLGLTWGYAPTTQMTYDDNLGYYKYTCTVEADGTYNFFFANGQGSDWNDFNSHYRIGPQSGDQAIAIDNNWVSTQMAGNDGGAYQINVAAGPVTIYFNPATMQFMVEATAPSHLYTFYIYPTDGTTQPHIYLWDNAQNVYTNSFPGNAVNSTEVLADGKTWYKYSETILVDVLNAIISAGGDNANNTKTKDITNFEPGTYYIVWDPVRHDGESYNHFELYNDPPSAVGDHQLFIHGGYYHNRETFSYTSDTGSELKYDGNTGNYYINNITLSSNATFCFTTQLGEDWQHVGDRYGNGGADGYTVNSSGGTNYLEVTEDRINTNMSLGIWSETYGEYKMFTAGVYNILVNPTEHWVKLIKTDHKNLSPMNVYLEQTSNVEINNIQEPGTTYTTEMFSGYWPLSAYNQEQGGWDPNSNSQHYPVKYIGDTTTVDGKHWWHWQVSASIAEVFFTRTNNRQPLQSEAIVRHAGVLWYTWDEINGQTVMTDHTREYFEAAANALPTNVVVMEGHYYVYFINTLGWDNVYCYAWDEAQGEYTDGYNRILERWPGHICERVGIDPATGYEVWRYDLGTITSIDKAPDGILFNDGDTYAMSDSKEQTGDFQYINGGVYDYLGLFDGAYTLNNLIRTAAEDVRYTVSNDLLGVFYDPNVLTIITYKNKYGENETDTIQGALYAKDLNQYGEKSLLSAIQSDGITYTDYVYDVCASNRTPGGSQIMVNKTTYDQSNWIKLIMSPNYDGRNPVPVASNQRPDLRQCVNRIIPAGSLDVFMTDTINPTAHVLAIKTDGNAMSYEPNVYISGNFNDTVVFNYTHRDWQPKDKDGNPAYKGNIRTKPVITWNYDQNGNVTGGTAVREPVEDDPYYMFYVAPKPQEVAYITWVVYDNNNTGNEWDGYNHNSYQPYTKPNTSENPPADPGRFFAPSNWDRSVRLTGTDYQNMQYLSETEVETYLAQGAHAAEYGSYYNGYMQYGGIKVNWSLFNIDVNNAPWWHIFTPGQAYKFKAIIRYARGNGANNSSNNYFYEPAISNDDLTGDYHFDEPLHNDNPQTNQGSQNAPRRADQSSSYANVYFTNYEHLNESKFIIFPIRATATRSNGDGIGNVTAVQEVIADVSTERDIVAVRYYNLMGMESEKPFDGINIIVTTYSDGTRSSRKVLR